MIEIIPGKKKHISASCLDQYSFLCILRSNLGHPFAFPCLEARVKDIKLEGATPSVQPLWLHVQWLQGCSHIDIDMYHLDIFSTFHIYVSTYILIYIYIYLMLEHRIGVWSICTIRPFGSNFHEAAMGKKPPTQLVKAYAAEFAKHQRLKEVSWLNNATHKHLVKESLG